MNSLATPEDILLAYNGDFTEYISEGFVGGATTTPDGYYEDFASCFKKYPIPALVITYDDESDSSDDETELSKTPALSLKNYIIGGTRKCGYTENYDSSDDEGEMDESNITDDEQYQENITSHRSIFDYVVPKC